MLPKVGIIATAVLALGWCAVTSAATPEAYYPFTGDASDQSGNGHHGTVDGATLSIDRDGASDSAYRFDGNDYIVVGNPPSVANAVTFAAWVRLEDLGGRIGGYVICQGKYLVPETYSLFVTESRVPEARVHVGGGYYKAESSEALSVGQWTHLTGVYDGIAGDLSIYVDGVSKGHQPISGALDQNTQSLYFGGDFGNSLTTWEGSIDEVRIYNDALGPEQVKAIVPELFTLTAHLDVKPGSWPNPVNPKSKGVTPMAVLGTETFDVMSIDPDTLALSREGIGEEVAPIRWAIEDVGTPFDGEPGDGHSLAGDGLLDLALKFDTQEMIEMLALIVMAGEAVELEITGALMDGTPFEATDWIRISAAPGGNSGHVRLVSAPAPGGTIVPEPATLGLLALGALAVLRRRRS